MERSVLEMFSDRSSALTLLGCRPSARKSLGRSQKRFQLLTKSSFCFLHHDNKHSFKAKSLLNLSCPRLYMGSVVSPRMQHDNANALVALQDRGYLCRHIENTSTGETSLLRELDCSCVSESVLKCIQKVTAAPLCQ